MTSRVLGWAVGILCAFASGVIGFWLTDRQLPVTVKRLEVVNPVVKQGEELRIRFYVNRQKTHCTIDTSRLIIDSQKARYILMERHFPKAPGPIGDDFYITPVQIPDGIALGRATYHAFSAFVCNPIQYIWPVVSDEIVVNFEVVP